MGELKTSRQRAVEVVSAIERRATPRVDVQAFTLLERMKNGDLIAAARAVIELGDAREAREALLRAAAWWPAIAAIASAISGVFVLIVAMPALRSLPSANPPMLPMVVGVALSIVVAVALIVSGRRRMLGPAWRTLDGAWFVDSFRALLVSGIALPDALSATAPAPFVRGLDAGTPDASTLAHVLDPTEAAVFCSALTSGTIAPALEALSAQLHARLEREVPAQAARTQIIGLLAASIGFVFTVVGFHAAYFNSLQW